MREALDQLRPALARVDLDRLAANYAAVQAAAHVPVMPVVKADAYGHGGATVARRFEALGAPLLAVAFVEEGVALRRAGVKVPIVVLAGFAPNQARLLLEHALTPVVSTWGTLEAALGVPPGASRPMGVHLKVDTGLTRLGFAPKELAAVAAHASRAGLSVEGLMTHLASADEDAAGTATQLDRLDNALSDLAQQGIRPRWIHGANGAGLAFLRPNHTLARVGLLLYGLKPRPLAPAVEVQPVMTLAGRIARIWEVAPGTAVSYGGRWVAQRPSRIATVPVGYADGVPRTDAMRERGGFSIAGRRAPVAGTVCMDLTMLDVTDRPEVREGDEAVVFGDDPTAWHVGEWAGTNAWQVLTSVGSRIPRVYVESGRVLGVESRYL